MEIDEEPSSSYAAAGLEEMEGDRVVRELDVYLCNGNELAGTQVGSYTDSRSCAAHRRRRWCGGPFAAAASVCRQPMAVPAPEG